MGDWFGGSAGGPGLRLSNGAAAVFLDVLAPAACELARTGFERGFAFKLGDHHVRGRVDRVDRLPDGGYELIDYKTGRAKTEKQLRELHIRLRNT